MSLAKFALFLAYILWPAAGVAQDSAEIGRVADTMVRLCLAGGHTESRSGALQERTRARVPLDWAMTQVDLANAPLSGSVSGRAGRRGSKRLSLPIVAPWKNIPAIPARAPLQWATTQNNLGTALATLGERESGTARLEEAVAAYREALQERTRARVPLEWARTQHNLGNALQMLGERGSGTARLDEAVSAYREALMERARARAAPMGQQHWRSGGCPDAARGTAR